MPGRIRTSILLPVTTVAMMVALLARLYGRVRTRAGAGQE